MMTRYRSCKGHLAFQGLTSLTCHLTMLLFAAIFVEEALSQACNSSQTQCLSGPCILFSERCDGDKNCPDGSDEFYCDPANISYALIWSTTEASSNLPQLFILYGDPDAYRVQMQLNQTFTRTTATLHIIREIPVYNFESLETDFSASDLYFSDGFGQYVEFGSIASTGSSYNISYITRIAFSDSVTGLSIDWVSKLLYWSDASYKWIGVASTKTRLTWAPIVENKLTSPRDVVVYPQGSFLFWSDVGNLSKIERLDLTNGVRQIIVSNANLQQPTTLVIDFVQGSLLFLDSKASRIGSVLLDGSSLTFWSLDLFSRISSFSLFKGYIFLGDANQSTSYVFNFSQKTYVGSVSCPGENGIIDLTVYEKAKQPTVASPCNANNGGCEHFCITINSTSRICKCAMGYFLNTNGISCVTQTFSDNFLLVADWKQQNIFQVDITTGEVRAALRMPPENFWPTLMDYDPQTMNIYAFDDFNKSIRRISISTQTSSTILQTAGATILGIAIDTVGRMLYYIDGSQNAIVQMTISGVTSTQTVLSEPFSKPQAIALDVYNRFIFWSNCYHLFSSSIEQANIANISDHHSVISGFTVCPTVIAIDSLNKVIYWGDYNGGIRRAGYDGTGQSLIYRSTFILEAYAGLALDETFLYITSSFNVIHSGHLQCHFCREILRINRATLQLSNLTAIRFVSPLGIVLYSSTIPTGPATLATSSTASPSSTATPLSPAKSSEIASPSNKTTIIIAVVICVSVTLIGLIVAIAFILRRHGRNRNSSVNNRGNTVQVSHIYESSRYAGMNPTPQVIYRSPQSSSNYNAPMNGNYDGAVYIQPDKYKGLLPLPPAYEDLFPAEHQPPPYSPTTEDRR